MRIIDVRHMGSERVIGCAEIDGVLIDPGPTSTVETLLEGLGEGFEPRAILLTHIHFDHAGGTGELLRRFPRLKAYVHERGARHMVDPERLVRSATRLYGEDGMRELWGEVVPVPEERLHVLHGGETVLGDFRVEYTPGHASHHVCYLHEPTGTAAVGDVGGVTIEGTDYVVAPTPPPDVDVAAWERSLGVVAAWEPERLALTHFGIVEDVPRQLEAVRGALAEQAERAARMDLETFVASQEELVRRQVGEPAAGRFLQAAPPEHLWLGLDRWRSKQQEQAGAA